MKILIVDDDPQIINFAKPFLEREGYTVSCANEAVSAMDLLRDDTFDLMICDANMPYYSGFELIKAVRGNERHKDMRIMMLSGLSQAEDVKRALGAGVDSYMTKPFTAGHLLGTITTLLAKK